MSATLNITHNPYYLSLDGTEILFVFIKSFSHDVLVQNSDKYESYFEVLNVLKWQRLLFWRAQLSRHSEGGWAFSREESQRHNRTQREVHAQRQLWDERSSRAEPGGLTAFVGHFRTDINEPAPAEENRDVFCCCRRSDWRTLFLGGGISGCGRRSGERVCFGGCPAASETWTKTTECRAAVLWVPWRWRARWSRDSLVPFPFDVFVIATPRSLICHSC